MYIRMLIFLEVVMKKLKGYFSKGEIILWSASVMAIIISLCAFDRTNSRVSRLILRSKTLNEPVNSYCLQSICEQ